MTLSAPVEASGVPVNANITFSVVALAAVTIDWPTLPAPSQDWLAKCLAAYGAFTLGTGFDRAKLRAAAATVFPDDGDAQDWMEPGLVALDALYGVLKTVPLPPPGADAFRFSVVEALYARGFTSAAKMTALSRTSRTSAHRDSRVRSGRTNLYVRFGDRTPCRRDTGDRRLCADQRGWFRSAIAFLHRARLRSVRSRI